MCGSETYRALHFTRKNASTIYSLLLLIGGKSLMFIYRYLSERNKGQRFISDRQREGDVSESERERERERLEPRPNASVTV